MKKLVGLILCLTLVFLAGCHNDAPDGTTETNVDSIVETTLVRPPEPGEEYFYTTPEEETPAIHVQYLPKTVEGRNDVPVLKWLCLVESWYGGKDRVWNETAVHELNKMLDDMDAGFQIQFVMLSSDTSLHGYDWFSRTEVQEAVAEADLIYGYIPETAIVQYLAPITQYTDTVLKNAVPHSAYWHAGTLDGEVYGISTTDKWACTTGWLIDESFLQQLDLGLTAADFDKDYWEMDTLFEKIAENHKGPFLYVQEDHTGIEARDTLGRLCYPAALRGCLDSVHKVGLCYAIDYSGDKPQVVNYLELEDVRNFQQAVIRYKKADYVTEDWTEAKIWYTSESVNTVCSQDGQLYVPVTDPVFARTKTESYLTGVAATSQYKEEALSLLSMIADNEEFRMQLFFGQMERDYTVKDGYYQLVKQEDGSDYSMDFLSPLAYFCGLSQDPYDATDRSPATQNECFTGADGQEKLKILRQMLDDSQLFLPITFDFTGYEQEDSDIIWILRRYYPTMTADKNYLGWGIVEMTPALYDLMLADLEDKDAGILLQELQEQLDDWLKENPDWK